MLETKKREIIVGKEEEKSIKKILKIENLHQNSTIVRRHFIFGSQMKKPLKL